MHVVILGNFGNFGNLGTILPKYIWTMAMPLVPTRSYFTGNVHTAAKVLLHKCCLAFQQTWKMSETLPEQDCLFPDFTRKCANYVNFEIATKQRNLSANTMFTTFTSLHG